MVTIDRRFGAPITPSAPAPSAPLLPSATPPPQRMNPVSGAVMSAMGGRSEAKHPALLATLFRHAPSVRTVLLGTTILASGMLAAGPALAQRAEEPTPVELPIATAPNGLSSALFAAHDFSDILHRGERMAAGDSGPRVEAIQRALEMLGVPLRGGSDGDYGGATADAVRTFRGRYGLNARDDIDSVFLRALDDAIRTAEGISTPRFAREPVFLDIALGRATLAAGTTNKAATEILQATLYGLGEDIGGSFVDGDFGDATTRALVSFQQRNNVPETGVLDHITLSKLDEAAAAQLSELRAAYPDAGTKHERYRIVGDLVKNRIYVIDTQTDEPIARYLTSPGRAGKRTLGDEFTVRRTLVRKTWYPTPSMGNKRPIGPGIDNPMGLVKFDLGRYYQYIHGTPFSVRGALGTPASSGCLRMSSENILDIADYIEPGSNVQLTRDRAESDRLAAAAQAAGIDDAPLDAGREKLASYLVGELGEDEVIESGRVVRK